MDKVIGIKFCGGCNPRYNRSEAAEQIKRNVQNSSDDNIAFCNVIGDEPENYFDNLIVICGCSSACASYDARACRGEIYSISSQEEAENIANI